MDYTTNVNNFENEIRSVIGGDPGPVQTDEKWHRFHVAGKSYKKDGSYIAYAKGDFVAGYAKDWHRDISFSWNSGGGSNGNSDNAEARAFFEECSRKMEEKRRALNTDAKKKAAYIWNNSKPAPDDHPYLLKKGVKAHGAKVYEGALVVPVMDKNGDIQSMQFISGDGSKRFLGDGKVSGGRYLITGEGDPILCEGFATGASIAEATGRPVVVAFNAGNLAKVAEPGMTIAGDNDAWTTKKNMPWNPGREKALTVAWQHNNPVVIPTFPDVGTKPTDFNDLAALSGLDAVKDQIEGAVLPSEYLLKECETDVGACYRPEHTKGLKLYQERNKAGYMTLRKELKNLGIGITELEKDLKQIRTDDSEGAPDHLTLAKEVISEHGAENLIYSEGFIWKWDAVIGVWQITDPREIKQTINAKVEKALSDPTKGAVDSIFDLLKTEIFRPNHKWNVEKSTINVQNGELAYSDGEWILQPHCREHFLTTQIPIKYDKDAIAERFEQYLEECFEDDQDKDEKSFLICELFGYSILTTTRYEKFVILIGNGANGKSVLLELLTSFVGAENTAAVQPSKFDSPFQRAYLNGKLVNAVSELAVGEEIKDAQMKAITSGELITCEHKFKDPFDLQPYCTIWLATNHLPRTRDFSPALFRRALIITFNRVFTEAEQDKNLKSKLKKELPGVLNLALKAISGVFRCGYFTEPESCKEAKKEWRLHADQAAEFAQDRCVMGPGLSVSSARLFAGYSEWSEGCGIKRTLSRNSLTTRLCNLGAERSKSSDGTMRMLSGIDLRSY